MSDSLWPHGLHSPWNSPGQNTGVGSLSLLQGIFPAQGSNPGLLHYSQIRYQLSHKESPRIPEWVAYPFSRGSSWPRNWTGVSCIARGFFTNWAIREDFNAYKSAGDLVKMQILTLSSLGWDLKFCIFKQQMATQVSEPNHTLMGRLGSFIPPQHRLTCLPFHLPEIGVLFILPLHVIPPSTKHKAET